MNTSTAWILDSEEETTWVTESSFLVAQIRGHQVSVALQRSMFGRKAEADYLHQAEGEKDRLAEGEKGAEAQFSLLEAETEDLREAIERVRQLEAEVAGLRRDVERTRQLEAEVTDLRKDAKQAW